MLKYEKFRQTVLKVITSSELDAGEVYYILKDIIRDVEIAYNTKIQEEYEKENLDSESESQN